MPVTEHSNDALDVKITDVEEQLARRIETQMRELGDQRRYFEALRSGDQRALDMASEERAKAAEALRDEQRRAISVAQEEREKAAKALSAGTDRAIADNFDRLSDRLTAYETHINQLLEEKDRAIEMATVEREKAAAALRDEQRRAAEVAERERAKAATALAEALARSIEEGDDRLREHIGNQIMQINAALTSADLLEVARISAVQHELQAAMVSASEAVGKAEVATEKRFESVNEWRAQSADRERSQAEDRAKLQSSFMLKEVGEGQIAQIRESGDNRYELLRNAVDALAARVDTNQGEIVGQRHSSAERQARTQSLTQILGVVIAVMSIVVIVAIATHGFTH